MLSKNYLGRAFLCVFMGLTVVSAQDFGLDSLNLRAPDLDVSIGIGFNYDYLKSPLDVSFETSRGIYNVNIPIAFRPSEELMDGIMSGVSLPFAEGDRFLPTLSARQFANTTIRVDVPMLRGVCSFTHMNVMSLRYENRLGMPRFRINPDLGDVVDALMIGNINVPLQLSMGWESMSFGYAYRINELVTVALNLHRHRFHFDVRGNIDVDIHGKVNMNALEGTNFGMDLNYSLRNPILGDYSLERWTPTFAVRAWKFDLITRFMFKDKATGALAASYSLPFFFNPSTFLPVEGLADTTYMLENMTSFAANEITDVRLRTNNNMDWHLPHVLTLKYHILPERLAVSYTKFIGRVHLGLSDSDLGRYGDNERVSFLRDGLDFRASLRLDHLFLLNANFGWFFGNLGLLSFDLDFNDEKRVLRNNADAPFLVPFAGGVMLPVLSGGGIIGTKLQLMLELNVLPLPALKTGLVYNF